MMTRMRLIDADELKEHLDYVCTGSGLWSNILDDVIKDCKEFVDHELTVDAVPVVRCRDCKHATMTSDGKLCKYCEIDTDDFGDQRDVYHDADWFCADGERKEGEQDDKI